MLLSIHFGFRSGILTIERLIFASGRVDSRRPRGLKRYALGYFLNYQTVLKTASKKWSVTGYENSPSGGFNHILVRAQFVRIPILDRHRKS